MVETAKISILVPKADAERFDAYCKDRGFKKSPLLARLIREHLAAEGYGLQPELFGKDRKAG